MLTDIYAAGEQPIPGVNIEKLANAMKHPNFTLHKDIATLHEKALEIAQPGDIVLFLGAGTITGAAERAAKMLNEKILAK